MVIVTLDMSDTPSSRLPLMVFGLLSTGAVAQCVLEYRQLPDRMASHFGATGAANGWMSKPVFFIVYAAMIGVSALIGYCAPRSVAKQPIARLNLPNKEYWLAPERRDGTFKFFRTSFEWYACVLLLILFLAMGLAIQANFTSPPRLPPGPILTVILAFVLFNLVWLIGIVRRFSKVN